MAIVASMNSGFDFFSPMPIQNSISERIIREVTPLNALQVGTPFEFVVLGGEGDSMYLDLAQSWFYFRVRARTSGDAAPAAAAEVSCINYLGHTMFQRVQAFLGDKEIGDANALYPYESYIEALCSHGEDPQKYWMYNAGFYGKDTAGKLDVLRTSANNVQNKGIEARHKVLGTGAEFELMMKPHHVLFNLDKFIPPGVPLKVRFTPAPNAFVLKRGDGNDTPKLEILEAKFYCNTVKATAAQDLAVVEAVRELGPIRINTRMKTVKTMSIAAGKTTAELDNIYYGPIPNRVVMAMVLDSTMSGSYASNPFNFQHFNLSEIVLVVNGKLNPSTPITPDFEHKRYIRAYHQFLQALNKANSEYALPITYEEYGGGFTIFAFDLTPDQNCEKTSSPQGTGSVRAVIKFSQVLGASINIILYAEYDGWIEIDQYKNVTTSINS